MTFSLLAPLLAALIGIPAAAEELVVCPAPRGESAFDDCSVEVNGKPVFVYSATVSGAASGASSSATSRSAAVRRFPRRWPDMMPSTASRMWFSRTCESTASSSPSRRRARFVPTRTCRTCGSCRTSERSAFSLRLVWGQRQAGATLHVKMGGLLAGITDGSA